MPTLLGVGPRRAHRLAGEHERPRRMKAARLHVVGDLRLEDEPVPETGPGMSLVRVTAVGICGSDLHWWGEGGIGDAALTRPLVPGHEAAGVVEGGARHGEPVAIDPAIWCGTCRPCRDGYRNLCTRIRSHSTADQLAWMLPTSADRPCRSG